MTETIKKYAPIILEEIKKAKSILLHCHPSPDPDSVGSALAMKFALEQLGKKVTVIRGDDNIPKSYKFPGIDSILQKNFFELDLKEFDLFIIQDCGGKNMISKAKEFTNELSSFRTIVIDHHATNKGYGDINCIDSSYPATAQMLFDIFKEIGIKFDSNIASNLFIGIYTDTGGFKYCKNTYETMKVASELSSYSNEIHDILFNLDNNNRKEALIFEGMALSSVKSYFNEKLVISSILYDELLKNNIKEEDYSTGLISNKLKTVIGSEIACTAIEEKRNFIKISFRTRDEEKYDVSKLAVALGGGGHKAAAGAVLIMNLSEAIEKIVKTAKEIYNL